MVDFMKWALDRRPEIAPELGYAPLPDERRASWSSKQLSKIKVQ